MKPTGRRVGLGVAVLAALFLLLQTLPARGVVPGRNPWRRKANGRPLVIAHGDGNELHPSNTRVAFEHSVALGCDALEIDLRLTADGVLVTHHDATIDRTSEGTGRVADFTAAALRERNFGYHFTDLSGARPHRTDPARLATVDELFERFPRIPLVLELKDEGVTGATAAAELARLIERHQRAASTIVGSFHDQTLGEFRRHTAGRVFTSTGMNRTRRFVLCSRAWLDRLAPTGEQALQIPVAAGGLRLDTPRLVRAAHRRNMAVHYWTVNDPKEMKRLIALGADGLVTDRPDRMLEVVRGLGY